MIMMTRESASYNLISMENLPCKFVCEENPLTTITFDVSSILEKKFFSGLLNNKSKRLRSNAASPKVSWKLLINRRSPNRLSRCYFARRPQVRLELDRTVLSIITR